MNVLVADRFELGPVIAEGGGGVVYHAWDRHGVCPVALKLLHARGNPMDLLREVKTLADLEHPRIVRYVGYGTADDGRTFIATEWLEGHTLASSISRGVLPLEDAAAAVAAAADGLRVAHARGVVHRDVKPSNLFLVGGAARALKVIDFGIASTSKRLEGADRGAIAGTPAYLSPEQARRATVDSRADVFSLGCVLHECLTGQRAFAGSDVLVLLGKVQFEEVQPARELRPELPARLDRLLARMLAKAAHRRPSMEEVLATLVALFPVARAVRPRDRTAERPQIPPALGLTDREERVWTVLMAASAPGRDDVRAVARTLAAEAAAASAAGARLDPPEVLGDGTPVLVFGDGQRHDDGAEPDPGPLGAARIALRIRAALPGASIALATGRGQLIGRLPLGPLLDRAAGLVSLCPPGRILLDEETARLVEDRYHVSADGGPRPDAVVLERQRATARHEPREVLGRPTPFVGRAAELEQLDQLVEAAFAASRAQVVLVSGEAGVGKSRLRHELVQRLERRGRAEVALASGDDQRGASPAPFTLVRQLLCSLGVDDRPLLAALEPGGERDQGGARPDDPRAAFDEVRGAWLRWLAGRLARGPLLLVVEDAHAADRPSLELLAAASTRFRQAPLVLLGLARSGTRLASGGGGWPEPAARLALAPLDLAACQALAAGLLGGGLPGAAALAGRAAGNPFFLEELIRAHQAPAEGRARSPRDEVPDTVVALLQARIDRLAPPLRRLLRAASVLRGGFDVAALRALLPDSDDEAELAAGLAELVREELLVAGDEAPPGHHFRHRIGQEAAYATLTEGDRTLGHQLAARWLTGRAPADPAEIAHHFEQAGDRPQAGQWLVQAAERALQANDLDETLALCERANRCGLRDEQLAAGKVVEARARFWRAEYLEAETAARRGLRAVRAGSAHWYRCLGELAAALGERAEYAELERLMTQAQGQRPEPEADGHRAACVLSGIGYLAVSGRRQTARLLLDGLVAERGALPFDDATQARIHSCRALLAVWEGDTWAQREETRRALDLHERAGNLWRRCEAMADLGSAAVELGELDEGIDLLRRVVAEAERLGAARLATAPLVNLVQALAWRGRFEDATALAATALDSAREQGNRRLEAGCFAFLAEAALLAGRAEEGERQARRALARAEGLEAVRPAVLVVLAWAMLERGQVEPALRQVEEALALVQKEGRPEVNEAMLQWVPARVLAASGHDARAADAAREARARLQWRADRIRDPAIRERFLALPHNRRILSLPAAAAAG